MDMSDLQIGRALRKKEKIKIGHEEGKPVNSVISDIIR